VESVNKVSPKYIEDQENHAKSSNKKCVQKCSGNVLLTLVMNITKSTYISIQMINQDESSILLEQIICLICLYIYFINQISGETRDMESHRHVWDPFLFHMSRLK
jgi:hypothetical protein